MALWVQPYRMARPVKASSLPASRQSLRWLPHLYSPIQTGSVASVGRQPASGLTPAFL